jgi:toxin ParE1/3/4
VTGRKYRLTDMADADIEDILHHTARRFGSRQCEAYQTLIERACRMVGEDPMRASSRPRDELEQGVRSFHVVIAAGRKGAASHILYYISAELEDGKPGAVILRVLWEGMDPMPYLGFGLDELG